MNFGEQKQSRKGRNLNQNLKIGLVIQLHFH